MKVSRLAPLLVCLPLLLAACGEDEPKQQQATPSPAPAPQTASTDSVAEGVKQAALADIVEAAQAKLAEVNPEDTEVVKAEVEALLVERRKAQCGLFEGTSLQVAGWEVKVQGVHKLQELLTLQVTFANDAYLMTSFGSGLDKQLGITTAFAEGAPLYDTVAALKPGDQLVVSGTFIESDVGCIFQVDSARPADWINFPTFLFQFSTVEKK